MQIQQKNLEKAIFCVRIKRYREIQTLRINVMKKSFTFNDKWNTRFMQMAQLISTWSKDTSTKVGCVIVSPEKEILSMGYNGFPRGVDDNVPERQTRPTKYEFVVHAEENAILNASRNGTRLSGGVLYVTMPPCTRCAGSIINSGIKEIIYLEPEIQKQIPGWRDNLKYSFEMFNEASVHYREMSLEKFKKNVEVYCR